MERSQLSGKILDVDARTQLSRKMEKGESEFCISNTIRNDAQPRNVTKQKICHQISHTRTTESFFSSRSQRTWFNRARYYRSVDMSKSSGSEISGHNGMWCMGTANDISHNRYPNLICGPRSSEGIFEERVIVCRLSTGDTWLSNWPDSSPNPGFLPLILK
jgi:hypothetical protein